MSTLKLSLVGLGSRVALMALTMLNALLLARILGPQGFGEYFLFLRVVSVLTVVADFGLSQSANAFFGRYEEWRAHLHKIILRFVPLFSACTLGIGALIVWLAGDTLLPNLPRQLTWMAFAVMPIQLYANIWISMMTGMGRIWQLNLAQLITSTLSLLMTLVFVVALSGGVITAATIYTVAILVQSAMMLAMALKINSVSTRAEEDEEQPPAALSTEMLHFGLRGYLGSFSYILWTRVPVFMLNYFHGTAAVGIFSVAQQLIDRMLLPVQAVQDASYRKMSRLSSRAARFTMNRYLRLTWWGMWVVVALGVLLAPSVIVLLLGQKYAASAEVCRLLLPGVAFMGAALLLDTYFLNQLRRPGMLSIVAWVNALVSLTLALLFIPAMAERGAALALVFTQILGGAVYFALYVRLSRARPSEFFLIHRKDLTALREQARSILRGRGGKG
ncbi:MAG: oligosaccharide flippase family protein [Pyrinomonadaceae bacterium]